MDKQEVIGYFEVQKDGCLASINWYETTPTSLFREKSLKELRYQLELCNIVITALSDRGYEQGYKDGRAEASKMAYRMINDVLDTHLTDEEEKELDCATGADTSFAKEGDIVTIKKMNNGG